MLAEDGVTPFALPDLTTAGPVLDTPASVPARGHGLAGRRQIGAGWHDGEPTGVDIFRDGETAPRRGA